MPRGDNTGKRGNPPIPVRMDGKMRERWHKAAKRDGMDFTDWVRQTLDARAADPAFAARVAQLVAEHRPVLDGLAATDGVEFNAAATTATAYEATPHVATAEQAEAAAEHILAQHQAAPFLPPVPQSEGEPHIVEAADHGPVSPKDCPHPREERERRSYGTICGACGVLVGVR